MNLFRVSLLAMTGLMAAPLAAQTAPPAPAAPPAATPAPVQIAVGAQVMGPKGAPVGTIASVGPNFAVVKTDKYEVRLPTEAFAARPEGLVIGASRDDLNASVEQAMGKIDDLLVAGATVHDTKGGMVGTINAVEGDLVTLKLASGKLVRLPKTGFAPGRAGPVVGLTAEQLEAQAAPPANQPG